MTLQYTAAPATQKPTNTYRVREIQVVKQRVGQKNSIQVICHEGPHGRKSKPVTPDIFPQRKGLSIINGGIWEITENVILKS